MNNNQLIRKAECTLIQVKRMAQIALDNALDNTNDNLSGGNQPFINQKDMSNLLLSISDLEDHAFDVLREYSLKEEITIEFRFGIESKLQQSLSLIRVISNNHKDEILDISNLLCLLNTLLEEVYKGFLDMNFKGGKNNG